jgi:hypothetical protein
MNVNTSAHKENASQNADVLESVFQAHLNGGKGRDTTPSLGCAAEPTINSGFACSASVLPITVKKTDFKDLKTGADYRPGSPDTVKSSMDQIADNGGPRSQMKGQRNSKNYSENGKAFRSTSNSPDSDSGN